jgi:hypothetical protein
MADIEEELKGLSREELETRFMRTMIWYHSEKIYPSGFYRGLPERMDHLLDLLSKFNNQLDDSAKSQLKLAKALNIFTFLLVIVGVVQILISRF